MFANRRCDLTLERSQRICSRGDALPNLLVGWLEKCVSLRNADMSNQQMLPSLQAWDVRKRNPLLVSFLALLASSPTYGFMYIFGQYGYHFDAVAFGVCLCSLVVWVIALCNLIRAEKQGCSSTKIGLSVAALCFAFVPPIGLALKLLGFLGESQH